MRGLIFCLLFVQVEFWDKHRDPGYEYPPDSLPGFSSEDYLQARSDSEGGTTLQEGKCFGFCIVSIAVWDITLTMPLYLRCIPFYIGVLCSPFFHFYVHIPHAYSLT